MGILGLSLLGCTPPSDTSDTSIDSAFDSTVPQFIVHLIYKVSIQLIFWG